MFCTRQSDTPQKHPAIVRYVQKLLRSSCAFCHGFHNESLFVLVVHNSILQGSYRFSIPSPAGSATFMGFWERLYFFKVAVPNGRENRPSGVS
jgi:hypothetical protein